MSILWIINHKIIHRKRYYGLFIEKAVKKTILSMRGQIFVDIGSNKGYYSKVAKKRFKRVITIDPNPKYHAQMQLAVSDQTGLADFYIYNNAGAADSLLKDPHILENEYKNDRDVFAVRTSTFDDLEINADLVKIDVEGAEFKVLDGMKRWLPKNMIVELHDERREQELIQKIESKGYHVTKIDPTHFLGWRR